MMCMMGVFAIVRVQPFGLMLAPGNLVVGMALLLGGLQLGFQRVFSLAIPTGAALIAMVGGLLTYGKVRGFELPGFPLIWLIVGLYIEMRLVLHMQNLRRQELAQKRSVSEANKEELVEKAAESTKDGDKPSA